MANKKKTKTRARNRTILGFVYMFIGCFLVYTLFSGGISLYQKQEDISALEEQKKTLQQEKETLENEIELLNDEDYVTRYARENYVFTRDGEKVAIIPGGNE